jgi:deoxyribodipyrimidine photo-lyase
VIQRERINPWNRRPIGDGRYVLYWMQAAQRAHYNHALEYAIGRANERKKPVVVAFGLTADFPQANARHYGFLLEGLCETVQALENRGIQTVVQLGSPPECIPGLAKDASVLVADEGHLTIQRQWRRQVAEAVECLMEVVETNLIVPVEEASEKEDFSAGTFRPRIRRKLDTYLVELKPRRVVRDSLGLTLDSVSLDDPDALMRELNVDSSVGRIAGFHGGPSEARRRLKDFVENKLDEYLDRRNDPNADSQSHLSPYLHFGQISPLEIALRVRETQSPGGPAFLEELIVRRELSHNFVHYNPQYDNFACLPPWVKRTLEYHSRDKREYVYSRAELEAAQTHDPYWNAAQKEMVLTGKMHGYMRMYWGKKILEWSKTPQRAFQTVMLLNNKYELDGRDPNGFAGVAWCFGKHDRAWAERPVYGKVRYMNAGRLQRKFDADAYVQRIERLARDG